MGMTYFAHALKSVFLIDSAWTDLETAFHGLQM